jgi:hypothetical protein
VKRKLLCTKPKDEDKDYTPTTVCDALDCIGSYFDTGTGAGARFFADHDPKPDKGSGAELESQDQLVV